MYRNKARNMRKKTTLFSSFRSRNKGKKFRWQDVMGTEHRTKKSRDESNRFW